MKKYTFEGEVSQITVDSIKTFIDDFKAGRLHPFLKSEEIPAE